MQIFRVIVRGRFDQLEPAVATALAAELEGRDELATYVFTNVGTLTYDRRLDFWSFRVEVRVDDAGDDLTAIAFDRASGLATGELERRGASYRDLRVTGTNMREVWT